MHAMLVTVDIESERNEESIKVLHEITIPGAKAQPGFQRGIWLRSADGSQGRGIVLFDTEENANASASMLREQGPPPQAPVKLRTVEVFEVVGEA
jgi:hypothetical protein